MAGRGMRRGGVGRGGNAYPLGAYTGGAGAGYASFGAGAGYADYDYYGYAAGGPQYATGYPAAAGFGGMSGSAGGSLVQGTHTSAKDPQSVKARVFVGNLNSKAVTRDQLERLYTRFGSLVALSIHKGYAFVQYTTVAHARSAVSFTDGMTLGGQVIDVNIADEPKDGKSSSAGAANGGASQAKRSRFDAGLDANDDLMEYPEFPDSLVCGHCNSKFTTWKTFRDHRKQPCQKSENGQDMESGEGKPDGEPDSMNCFICKNAFPHSWSLITHLGSAHNMQVHTSG